jgi:hypothetical protein
MLFIQECCQTSGQGEEEDRDDREGIPHSGCAHHGETRNVLTEQTNLLSDIVADTEIFLPLEPLIQDIHHRFLSGDKPLPVDSPHVL